MTPPSPRIPPAALLALALLVAADGCRRVPVPPTDPDARTAYWSRLDSEYAELTRGYDEETGARQVTVEALRELMARGENVVLLDIRESRENRVSSLPEARHIAPDDVGDATLEVPDDATLVTYCTAGYRSGSAAVKLEDRLGRQVFNLHGGIIAWFNAGGEVRDPSGKPVDKIDAYGPSWEKFVHPRK